MEPRTERGRRTGAGSGFTKSETAPWVASQSRIGVFALRLEADAAKRLTAEEVQFEALHVVADGGIGLHVRQH
jgi:hypothetical protein